MCDLGAFASSADDAFVEDLLSPSENNSGGRRRGSFVLVSTSTTTPSSSRKPPSAETTTASEKGNGGGYDHGDGGSFRTLEQREALATRGSWDPPPLPRSSLSPTSTAFLSSSAAATVAPDLAGAEGQGPGDGDGNDDLFESVHTAASSKCQGSSEDPERDLVAAEASSDAAVPPDPQLLTPGHAARLGKRPASPRPLPPARLDTGGLIIKGGTTGGEDDAEEGKRRSSSSEVVGRGGSGSGSAHSRASSIISAAVGAAVGRNRHAWRLHGGGATGKPLPPGAGAAPSTMAFVDAKGAAAVAAGAVRTMPGRRRCDNRLSGLTQQDDEDFLENDGAGWRVGGAAASSGGDPLGTTSETGGATRLITSLSSAYDGIRRGERGNVTTSNSRDEDGQGGDACGGDRPKRQKNRTGSGANGRTSIGAIDKYDAAFLCRQALSTPPRKIAFVSCWAAILLAIIIVSALLVPRDGGGGAAAAAAGGNGTTALGSNGGGGDPTSPWAVELQNGTPGVFGTIASTSNGTGAAEINATAHTAGEEAPREGSSFDDEEGGHDNNTGAITAGGGVGDGAGSMSEAESDATANPFALEAEDDNEEEDGGNGDGGDFSAPAKVDNIFGEGGVRRRHR